MPSDDAIEAVSERLRAASRTDIATFRAERGRPARTLVLTLRLEGSSALNATLDGVARLTALAEPLAVVAAGGTGKSTTLLQLADRMLAEDGPVPLLVPLGEWSDRPDDFLRLHRYPQLGLVISTRRQALPVAGPVITIEALSHDQQMELASALRSQDGIDLVDRAWRTPGVRDLVGFPLYLNALLTLPPGARFPET